ncbi:MAG TPA: Lrp/AsnC ligand binding domain-containing protein [Actinocrinis sp.]|jgi:DNA-binding Lrp family transcriptional regulator
MVTAIVMIKTDVDRIPEVASAVSGIDGVSEAYSVTGEWNLIAVIRVREHDELADLIPGRLNKIPGIVRTETHIAFRAYSKHDLEAAFALGLE